MDGTWVIIVAFLGAWGIGLALFVALLRWRKRNSKNSAAWRLLSSLVLVLILPFPVGFNNGHSAGWGFIVPLGLVPLVDLVFGLLVTVIATFVIFVFWSAIRRDAAHSKKSKLEAANLNDPKCPTCLAPLNSSSDVCPKCGIAQPKQS